MKKEGLWRKAREIDGEIGGIGNDRAVLREIRWVESDNVKDRVVERIER